jgi:transposase InsO family protein
MDLQTAGLATVLDLYSRRLLACPTSEHPDVQLACDAIKIAAAVRGGRDHIDGVIFHSDRGSVYTSTALALCIEFSRVRAESTRPGPRPSDAAGGGSKRVGC